MPEKNQPYLILEAIKVLIWPALVVAAVFWLGADLKSILTSRTWKIGIIEVGDRISNLGSTLQDEFITQKDYLDQIIANTTDPKVIEYARKALESIKNAQKGIKKEVQNIQEVIPRNFAPEATQAPSSANKNETASQNPTTANGWESLGFKFLLDREIKPSIEAFSQSEKIWPDLHNVSEIRKLLIQNRVELEKKDSTKWKEIYQKILTKYSWGMPLDAREKMQKYIASQ